MTHNLVANPVDGQHVDDVANNVEVLPGRKLARRDADQLPRQLHEARGRNLCRT